MKLVQKSFLKGNREFEIVDDTIFVRIKSLLKEEKLTIDLSILDPEPSINASEMQFYNPHKGYVVFSLLLNKPNAQEFNRFVDTLKQTIKGEGDSIDSMATVSSETARSALARNVYEEPPAFDEPADGRAKISGRPVNADRLADDIEMLSAYLNKDDLKPLLDALEVLRAEPESEKAFQKMLATFDELGINQGAVLTYAPYLKVLLSEATYS